MRFNKNWLDEYVSNNLSAQELSDIITMAGLEVDTYEPVAASFDNVVVAHVLECEDHKDSDHLHVTKVDCGNGEIVQVVCGAKNCVKGLKVALAKVGATLPGFKIKPAKLRGVESFGMLCSFQELGMAEESEGIIELPQDAPVGMSLREYLSLDDNSIEVDLTSNRPDCLSIRGIAREVGVLLSKDVKHIEPQTVTPTIDTKVEASVESFDDCPRYLCRVIEGVDQSAKSPVWMTEKLRRCGIRAVSPIVDVTNYVMLELGQPLHSFDLDKLNGSIKVRRAKDGEVLTLLSGDEAKLDTNTLVIADEKGPVALAGIFGGLNSGINDKTTNVLLESAFFSPLAIKGRARHYGLNTDASHRFERGVDCEIQDMAIQRATELLIAIAGGNAGPVTVCQKATTIHHNSKVVLRRKRLDRVLGKFIDNDTVLNILSRLGFNPEFTKGATDGDDTFTCIAPSFRFDIAIEEDLIEEVARIYGYNNIENKSIENTLVMAEQHESILPLTCVRDALVALGYTEAITYSFTDPKVLQALGFNDGLKLNDPISPELSVMRPTLIAGLAIAAKYNLNRQQKRIRFFETGLSYLKDENAENGVRQDAMLCTLCTGDITPESWSNVSRHIDYFDVKGDFEALLEHTANKDSYSFVETKKSYLHPGQAADIVKDGVVVGSLGILHPQVQKALGFKSHVGVIEILQSAIDHRVVPVYKEISKFPSIKRDFAFVVNKSVKANDLICAIKEELGNIVCDVNIFDVFEGESLGEDKRSIALSVVMQDTTRTLDDEAVDNMSSKVIEIAKSKFDATLRS